jgi:hypothetical protein
METDPFFQKHFKISRWWTVSKTMFVLSISYMVLYAELKNFANAAITKNCCSKIMFQYTGVDI